MDSLQLKLLRDSTIKRKISLISDCAPLSTTHAESLLVELLAKAYDEQLFRLDQIQIDNSKSN